MTTFIMQFGGLMLLIGVGAIGALCYALYEHVLYWRRRNKRLMSRPRERAWWRPR